MRTFTFEFKKLHIGGLYFVKNPFLDFFWDFASLPNPTRLCIKNWTISIFLLRNYITSLGKSLKELMSHIWDLDWRTDGLTNEQSQIYSTLLLGVVQRKSESFFLERSKA